MVAIIVSAPGCERRPDPSEANVPTQPAQTVAALTDLDRERLAKQRAFVESFLADDASRQKYQTTAGKLGTLRAILDAGAIEPGQTYELQCLGIVLGDALVQELGMEWVMVEDQHGRDPAVRVPGTTVILFPLTMISKRVERGEKVDVFSLFNQIADKLEDVRRRVGRR